MIVRIKPKIPNSLKREFDKIIKAPEKNFQQHYRYIKNLSSDIRTLFMEYISYKFKIDMKEYQKLTRYEKLNLKKIVDYILSVLVEIKNKTVWKDTSHMVKGVYLGEMYYMKYRNFEHDPFPLAIFLNTFDNQHHNFHAINLHYLTRSMRTFVVNAILKANKARIQARKNPIVTYDLVKKILPTPHIAYRNYKAKHIKLIEKIDHHRWQTYIRIDDRKVIFVK